MVLTSRQIACDTEEHTAMLDLRERILRRPIGLVVTPAEIACDRRDYLLGCFDGAVLAGCLILQKDADGWVKMRQVAVDEKRQGRGIGAQMLDAAEAIVRSWKYAKIYCHARETARSFYAQNNWVVVGDTFDENGIPHCRMEYFIKEAASA
jgi:predicted GNAT family N-acyltransferase